MSRSVGLFKSMSTGKQEILVVNRNAVAGIKNDRRFRLRQRRGEIRHRLPHLGDVEVVTIDDIKAQLPESFRYGPGVVSGVVEVWGDLIVSVADHERYTLFGVGVRRYSGPRTWRRLSRARRRGTNESSRNKSCKQIRAFTPPMRLRPIACPRGNPSAFGYGAIPASLTSRACSSRVRFGTFSPTTPSTARSICELWGLAIGQPRGLISQNGPRSRILTRPHHTPHRLRSSACAGRSGKRSGAGSGRFGSGRVGSGRVGSGRVGSWNP